MEIKLEESEIVQTLKDKLDIGLDEAKKIFSTIEDKLPDTVNHEDILKLVTTYVTKNPIKSLLIALAIGIVLTKMIQKSS